MTSMLVSLENGSTDDLLARNSLRFGERGQRSLQLLVCSDGECHDPNDTNLIPQADDYEDLSLQGGRVDG